MFNEMYSLNITFHLCVCVYKYQFKMIYGNHASIGLNHV